MAEESNEGSKPWAKILNPGLVEVSTTRNWSKEGIRIRLGAHWLPGLDEREKRWLESLVSCDRWLGNKTMQCLEHNVVRKTFRIR
jgi:hypothetical protein